jgi:hypothetical protein
MKRVNILRVVGLGVILWGAGVIAVNTNGQAACGPQTGFTGFMHKALFAPSATCGVAPSGGCQNPGSKCSTNSNLSAGKGNQGTCQTQGSGPSATCQCVALPVNTLP